ncbi:Glycosyltransferase [Xenorhabdus stockiae]|uniref:Glycosyltransferase n=1 Tax=Xenorhabdus stockiae TaxID=351614 RepID=A0A2D0KS46_9GAMM|nr:glycosyltransferase [Xenorhabdus stockiae]PHM66198.1 Glycosyltransferase [Xenorhabdus stockiae]
MKVSHIINLQGFGGAERLFIEYLKNSSFENYVICTSNDVNKNILSELSSSKIIYSNRIINKLKFKYPAFIRKFILQIKIERAKPDLVIVWDFVPKLLKKTSCPIIYYDHGCSWRYSQHGKTLEFFSMLNGAIAASHAACRVMEIRFKPVFPIETITNRLSIAIEKKTKDFIKNSVVIGTASRLVSLKGISVSILVVNELIRKNINTQLLIAGDGEIKNDLEELVHKLGIEKHVKFIGYQADMSKFYKKIDIYMSSPITEPFGLSCIEALSNAVPVIFPLVDGQPEAVKDGYCGIGLKPTISIEEHKKLTGIDINFPHQVYDPINDQLTEPKLLSHIDCANAIERLLKDPSLYESMSRNAVEWSKESMNYEKFLHEFEDALSSFAKPALPRK